MKEPNEQERTGRYTIAEPGLERGFTQVPNWILLDQTLSGPARLAYSVLLHFAYLNGNADPEPTIEEIASVVGISERRLRPYLKELAGRGIIAAKRRGQGKPNRYVIGLTRPDKTGRSVRSEPAVASAPRAGASGMGEDLKQDIVPNGTAPAARKRDVVFDALAEETGADPRSRGGEIGTAAAKIRGYVAAEVEGAGDNLADPALVVERIREQADLYRRVMDGAILTPPALAKWWFDLAKIGAHRGGGMSAEEMFAEAQADHDAERIAAGLDEIEAAR